jgi:hypothetical protein
VWGWMLGHSIDQETSSKDEQYTAKQSQTNCVLYNCCISFVEVASLDTAKPGLLCRESSASVKAIGYSLHTQTYYTFNLKG